MQGDRGGALLLGREPGVEIGEVLVVDAHPHLHRDRDVAPGTLGDDGGDDGAEEVALPGQGRAAALAGDLGDRAAEVEVDVVGPCLLYTSPSPRD